MKSIKLIGLMIGIMAFGSSFSATLYVGTGAQCNESNHFSNLTLALAEAALNGVGTNDEIRLTNTIKYTGNGDGVNTLADWNPSVSGELTLVGGFADCDSPGSSGMTSIGGGAGAVFDISGNSVVRLRNLQLINSQSRGLIVRESSVVFLESVDVSGNAAGLRALDGSIVSVDAASIIQNNGDLSAIPKGGGIWCFGANTEVYVFGSIEGNQAISGGNMYVEDGCYVQLEGGSRVKGGLGTFEYSADDGGGIMVHNGGELYANGGASRVQITDHWAFNGSGLYVHGTGRATLLNTYIANNKADVRGAGLFAIDGGTGSNQVVMDRVQSCPNLISCSEFERNTFAENVVYLENSKILIQRTLFDRNEYVFNSTDFNGLVTVRPNATLQMSHVNMINNEAHFLWENFGTSELSHITAVDNYKDMVGGGTENSYVWFSTTGVLRFENSIFQDTLGGQNAPTTTPDVSGKCNLIDNSNDWPVGAYVIGSADFINSAGGDSRQLSSSAGVDMCLEDTFAWSTGRDIEYQDSPVNENTNPQGMPGESGGLYDAGFDEVYDNIGTDEFLLTVQKTGSGEGFVVSDPLGISCGTDCSEIIFNGTLIELSATAFSGSEFLGWSNCPLPNGTTCFITVTESTTVGAVFQPDDLIFMNGFD